MPSQTAFSAPRMSLINLHSPKPSSRSLRLRSALALVGAFLVLAAIIGMLGWYEFDGKASPVNWGELAVLTALMMAWICLVVAWGVYAYAARCAARTERGEGVHVRWTVDPASWRELGEQRHVLDQPPGAIKTYPRMPAEAPPGGVEIVVSNDGIFIGPEFRYPLPPLPVLQARLQGHWLELDCLEDMPTHVLRVPVPPDARPAVQRLLSRPGSPR